MWEYKICDMWYCMKCIEDPFTHKSEESSHNIQSAGALCILITKTPLKKHLCLLFQRQTHKGDPNIQAFSVWLLFIFLIRQALKRICWCYSDRLDRMYSFPEKRKHMHSVSLSQGTHREVSLRHSWPHRADGGLPPKMPLCLNHGSEQKQATAWHTPSLQ